MSPGVVRSIALIFINCCIHTDKFPSMEVIYAHLSTQQNQRIHRLLLLLIWNDKDEDKELIVHIFCNTTYFVFYSMRELLSKFWFHVSPLSTPPYNLFTEEPT